MGRRTDTRCDARDGAPDCVRDSTHCGVRVRAHDGAVVISGVILASFLREHIFAAHIPFEWYVKPYTDIMDWLIANRIGELSVIPEEFFNQRGELYDMLLNLSSTDGSSTIGSTVGSTVGSSTVGRSTAGCSTVASLSTGRSYVAGSSTDCNSIIYCTEVGKPAGCRFGDNCRYSHICKFYPKCDRGPSCKFKHI